jgi:iron complex outermembrane receptor protein
MGVAVSQKKMRASAGLDAVLRAFPLAATLGLSTGLLVVDAAGARAQNRDTQEVPTTRSLSLAVPPQSLSSALTDFGRQAGIQIVVDPTVVANKTSGGVSGNMTVEQALQRLLTGTGIPYRFTSPNSVSVGAAPSGASGAIQLDPVQVQGFPVPQQAMIDNLPPAYAGGQVATGGQLGLLGNRDVMDTPFNQTSYTAKKAKDQQATTIREVLIDDPSVRTVGGEGGPGVDALKVRGFDMAGLSIFSYGGLYGLLPTRSIMAELAERVEVLKGPSAMLNGMQPDGGIGGTLNIVPKRAPEEPLTQVTANYASAAQFGGHVDVGRRYGADKQFGVRANGVFKAGQTDVRWNSDQRSLALLGLDFRGDRARFSADIGYQYQYIGGVIGYLALANGVPVPWAPSVRTNPAGQPWNYQERKDLFGVFRGEFDLTDRITAYAAFGALDARLAGLESFATNVTNFNGNATAVGARNLSRLDTYRTAQAGVRALVDTGPIDHELAFTASGYDSKNLIGSVSGASFATNIYNPTVVARPSVVTPEATLRSTSQLLSFGLADTLSAAGKRIQLTIGARLQQVSSANFNSTTGAQTSSYSQSALSPSVALVFKPWQNVSIYGNWIQGLQPGTTVGSTFTNAGEVFAPFKATQFEAGVKVDWGRFTTTASVFKITQPSLLTNVATNTQYPGGEQVNQGIELNVFGEPMEGVRLLGGAMFLSPVLAKTQGGLTDGWIAPFTPTFQFNIAGEWDLPFARGLTLNGRVVYTGSQYIDTTWPRRSLAEWTRFDAGVRYGFENPGAKGKLVVARFNVENVLDANYWQGQGGGSTGTLVLGAPRTFRLSVTSDF